MYLFRVRSLLLVAFTAVIAAGCGDGRLSSPTAPSALPEAMALDVDASSDALASTTDDGGLVALGGNKGHGGGSSNSGSGKDKDKDRAGGGDKGPSHDETDDAEKDDEGEGNHGHRGSLSGFVTAVGADSITIRGIVVKITDTTVIRHGHRRLALADVAVGDHAQAKGTMSADRKTLTAAEVKVEDTGRDNDDDDEEDAENAVIEVKGAVAGLTGTCPAMTFTIGTTTVKTNSDTKFDDVTCAALANGNTVEVQGKKQADNSVLASTVELESGANEVEGQISGLTGTCPSLTFTVGTTTVTTSSATVFNGVACTALANGTKVEVEGTLSGTTLAAASLELD
ncbi:MAG: hypothetical protein HYU37_00875 [Acidobacteria bacterium]|nr:hypothetical protein [Acidobacteriota bacterium]